MGRSSSNTRAPLGLTYSEGGVPVFYPTMDEFRDFAQFIKQVDKYGMEKGIVKVVPPKEWVDSRPQLDEAVKSIKIKNPIIQHINGTGGAYRLQNIEKKKTYDISGWRKVCQDLENQPPARRGERRKKFAKKESNGNVKDQDDWAGFDYRFNDEEYSDKRCNELEKTYWRSLTYSSAMYGADMPGSLFDDSCTIWNVAHLDNILNNLKIQIPGVNTAYLYCGMWKSTFAWHLEDMDLYSINYIHFGAPKQWYSISQKDKDRFFDVMKEIWPEEYSNCKEFLRHKTFNASPALLEQYGIKVNKVIHHQNEFMITFPYGYHSGFNFDYNVAESVNFATEAWLPYGQTANKCRCIDDSVGIDVNQLVRWMNGEEDVVYEDDNGPESLPTPPYTNEDKPAKKRRKIDKPTKKVQPPPPPKKPQQQLPPSPPPYAKCELCPDVFDHDLIQGKKGKYVHRICAQLIPETGVTLSDSLLGLERIPNERLKLKCLQCGSPKGACIKCMEPKCSRVYHASCAYPAGVLEVRKGHNQPSEFLCRFHRPKRPQKINVLETDPEIQGFAYSLLPGDIVQCQMGTGDIFAGVVDHNNLSENTVMIKVLPAQTDVMEVEWKWIRPPYTQKTGETVPRNTNPKKNGKFAPNGEKIQFTGFKKDDSITTDIQTIENVTWVTDQSVNIPSMPVFSSYPHFFIYRPDISTMSTAAYYPA
jgi:hypothetical protein